MDRRVSNFNAGPSVLPLDVLTEVQNNWLNYENSGMSIAEISHRSKQFVSLVRDAKNTLCHLLSIPSNYTVLFMSGGGSAQFAAIPLNLLDKKGYASYLVTGSWSAKAAQEAQKFGRVHYVTKPQKPYTSIPPRDTWQEGIQKDQKPSSSSTLSSAATANETQPCYFYYCANETIDGYGIEFDSTVPDIDPSIPLVADFSSSFCTRPIDVSKFGLIFATAQKNVGPAGVTIVIVRNDLLGRSASTYCPTFLNYQIQAKHDSLYHTPVTISLYMTHLVLKWIRQQGGLEVMHKRAKERSDLLYDAIDQSDRFYRSIAAKHNRSRINVVFFIGQPPGNRKLQNQFIVEAEKQGLIGLAGHRAIGGLRASLYNAMDIPSCKKLVAFMESFAQRNRKAKL